jgi:hypothetical protein
MRNDPEPIADNLNISDIGRVVPYVAPRACPPFPHYPNRKTKQARDADAKCNDLVDHISFMLGRLAVLRRVKVMDVTLAKQVDRMILTLRDAASLIQPYRKRSLIVRRLNVSNGDKFASCVQAANLCSSDLIMSLQIHQSGQLDILTRSVPVDLEDKAAQSFISHHGGVDAVKQDQTLVTECAEELHLEMEGDAMEQVNTDISVLSAYSRPTSVPLSLTESRDWSLRCQIPTRNNDLCPSNAMRRFAIYERP